MPTEKSVYLDPEELLLSLGVVLDGGYGNFKGRPVRLQEFSVLQVGDSYFDRWANSRSMQFNLATTRTQQDFLNWAEHFVGGQEDA